MNIEENHKENYKENRKENHKNTVSNDQNLNQNNHEAGDNSTIRIALGDLRHKTCGRHAVFMPIGISFLASHMLEHTSIQKSNVRLYDDPEIILKDLKEWVPDIIALSNYCWNAELTQKIITYAKKINPNIICIMGGPEVPRIPESDKDYFLQRKEIDFFIVQEGERAFSNLINNLVTSSGIKKLSELEGVKSTTHGGIVSIHPQTKELIFGGHLPRITNLDEIPSPYLMGLMEQFFDGAYAPSVVIARGCPYTCGFCSAGHQWYSRVVRFSPDRLKKELDYIAQRMKKYPDVLLAIMDSNFGMYQEDEEIAEYIRTLQDKYDWPNAFDVTTGKANYDRILNIAETLKNKMFVSSSVQTLNPKTLEIIKRRNLPMDQYKELLKELKRKKMITISELIMPLPEETIQTFFDSIKTLYAAGVDFIIPYTTMLLKGTTLSSAESRKKYSMVTKYRLIPRQFGEYVGEKCFEVEEVCVATNTMSFEEYLEGRGFALISALLSSEQYDIIFRHLKELNIDKYSYIMWMFERIQSGNSSLSDIYNQFIEETKKELWDSKEELSEFFSKEENYAKLLEGRFGDNLLRKYQAKIFREQGISSINFAYEGIKNIAASQLSPLDMEILDVTKQWMVTTRNVWSVFDDNLYREKTDLLILPYDVLAWYENKESLKPLREYQGEVRYQVFCDVPHVEGIIKGWQKLFGSDPLFQFGKGILNRSVTNFWRKVKRT